MKLTKEECLDAIESLKEKYVGFTEVILTNYEAINTLEQLINEHFDNMARTCQNLVSEIDKLEKTLEELREQGASAMDEVQALRNENEMLKRRNVGLEQTISNQNKKLHSYYMAMVTNKE